MSYLSHLLQQLIEKREQLIRLKNTKITILNLQDILVKQELSVDGPALTASLWNGNTARSFVDKREVVKSSYIDITYSQIGNAIQMIDDKISSIQVDIQTLEINIELEKLGLKMKGRLKIIESAYQGCMRRRHKVSIEYPKR